MAGAVLKATGKLNGIDLDYLGETIEAIKADPASGMTKFRVTSSWQGQTRSETKVRSYVLGGQEIEREFQFRTDEPTELCGTNQFPNPQEYLMGALNACMMVGYVAACALNGIQLEKLEIETEGDIDLRGFLAIDPNVIPGYDTISYTVRIQGDGTPEQFADIHRFVQKTSPNFYNIANAIQLNSKLVVE
ncbi:OsmC family protein [Synechococcus sp. PCC 7336]|uniref:OsmC family protein n=1 Tax=Synechococcus sp. PCC 7336 TaxID=195250 RepID=UPI00034B4534|nr:OsmC family protein [Synechococcus sp. PCC 7336]